MTQIQPAPPFEPTRRQAWAAIMAGSAAMIVTGLQPLLLSEMAYVGRLSPALVHPAAVVEMLAMAAAVALFAFRVAPNNLPRIGLAAGVVAAAACLGGLAAQGWGFLALRAIGGFAGGVLVWITIGMIARRERSEPWAAAFFMIQAVGQVLAAAFAAIVVMQAMGRPAGMTFAAVLAALGGLAAMGLPRSWPDLAQAPTGRRPGARGWMALGALFFYFAGVATAWFHMRPLAAVQKLGDTGPVVLAVLVAQMVGVLLAMMLARRVGRAGLYIGVAVVTLASYGLVALSPGPMLFLAGFALAAMCSLVLGASLFSFLKAADPSRRAGGVSALAQLTAAALGPLLGMLWAERIGPTGALMVAAGLIVAGLGCVASLLARPKAPVEEAR
jgi:hypothetical protein